MFQAHNTTDLPTHTTHFFMQYSHVLFCFMHVYYVDTGEGEGYYNLTEKDYPALESQPSHQAANVSGYQLNFTKQYFYNKIGQSNSSFVLTVSVINAERENALRILVEACVAAFTYIVS